MATKQGQGVVLGYLKYVLGFDSLAFEEGVGDAEKRMKAAQKSLQKSGDGIKDMGAKLSLAVSAPLAAFAAASVQGFKAQQAAMAQVDAAIASMGNTAGLSSAELSKFADGLELKSLFDADEILKKSTANLLTFGNVAGDNFKKAQQAAVDLASRMEGDLQGATLMVGKALNDPIKGLTALSRVGIQFTEQQKEQIKTMQEAGNVAGAQAIILGELNRQFGGAAEAAAKADPMREVMVKLGQAGDAIGEKLLPIIPVLADALVSVLDAFNGLSPETQKWVLIVGAAAAALGPVLIGIGSLVTGLGAILPVLGPVAAAFGTFVTIITTGVIPAIGAVLVALAPILVPLAAVAAAVAAVYLAWKNWDKIEPVLRNLYNGVKTWIGDKLSAIWNTVKAGIQSVADKFKWLWDVVVGHSYVPDLVDDIGAEMARLDKVMVQPINKATSAGAKAFKDMASNISGLLDRLFPEQAEIQSLLSDLALLDQAKGNLDPSVYGKARDKLTGQLADRQNELALTGDVDVLQRTKAALGDIVPVLVNLQPAATKAQQALESFGNSLGDSIMGGLRDFLTGRASLGDALRDGLSRVLDHAITDSLRQLEVSIFGEGGLGSFLGSALKSLFGSIFGGARALGGPVSSGRTYLVGEHGPELFTAQRSGYIHSNDATQLAARSGGAGISIGSMVFPGVTNAREARETANQAAAVLRNKIALTSKRGY
ncbi:phage tail length tape measure family protein [Sphingobium sp. MI1205]|uniref:phage tail length tape measure family protein n=1 Tax=Sphingobium sp. MI1205 TaxID=407020 RepID=UPI0007703A81|nr:phage tail length tape measure family protein [Sphingobium sp. MI1205]AMK19330.1 phage tail tape measure protein, TP901 family [Sphingobium sp. MI1205]